MSIFVDIVIIAVMLLSIIMGYKKGLIGVIFKIASFIIAIILAFALSKPVTNYIIANTEIDDNLHMTIQKALESNNSENPEEYKNENMPEVISQYITEQIKTATANAQNEVAKVVATNLTGTIINGLAFIGIFIIAKILLFFLKFLIEAVAKIPVLKQFNEIGGLIYGVLKGLFIIYLIFTIISLIAPIINNTNLQEAIQASYIGSMMYNNNILLKILF